MGSTSTRRPNGIFQRDRYINPKTVFDKFKVAVNGAKEDRAATGWYDVGLQLRHNDAGELGFQVRALRSRF